MLTFITQAYDRINEKRSKIAGDAVKRIDDHIRTLATVKDIKDWCRWAKRPDGPVFWKKPAPKGITNKKDPNYEVGRWSENPCIHRT